VGGGRCGGLCVRSSPRMICAMGVRYPARVVGAGGIFLEYDGRDVPDVATIVADYAEGCQLIITGTMINDHPIEDCIRGRNATIKFTQRQLQRNGQNQTDYGYEIRRQEIANRPTQGGGRQAPPVNFVGGGISE